MDWDKVAERACEGAALGRIVGRKLPGGPGVWAVVGAVMGAGVGLIEGKDDE